MALDDSAGRRPALRSSRSSSRSRNCASSVVRSDVLADDTSNCRCVAAMRRATPESVTGPARPRRVRHADLREPLEQDSCAQTLPHLEGLRDARRLRFEELSGQPLVVASPIPEQGRSTALFVLAGAQTLDGFEGLEGLADGGFDRQGGPHQPQPGLPGVREQETLAIDADQGERLLTQAFGLLRIPGGHELRARPQTRDAQARRAKRRLQLEASVKMCAGACRIETSEEVSEHFVRLRFDQGIVQASRLGHHSLGIGDEPGADVGISAGGRRSRSARPAG